MLSVWVLFLVLSSYFFYYFLLSQFSFFHSLPFALYRPLSLVRYITILLTHIFF